MPPEFDGRRAAGSGLRPSSRRARWRRPSARARRRRGSRHSSRRRGGPAWGTALRMVSSGRLPPMLRDLVGQQARERALEEVDAAALAERRRGSPARSVCAKLSPSVTAMPLPLPKMRRASRSAPSAAAPACRSRASARDTGTPNRASRSAGATVCSQRAWPWRTCISVMARTPVGTVNGSAADGARRATGAKTNASPARVLASCTMQTPDAPRLAADGKVTAMAKYIATAASVALPPACRMSRPTSAARLSSADDGGELEPPRSSALSGARLAATPERIGEILRATAHFRHKPTARTAPTSASLRN